MAPEPVIRQRRPFISLRVEKVSVLYLTRCPCVSSPCFDVYSFVSDRVQDKAAARPQAAVCEPVPKQSIALGAFLLCCGIGFLLYAVLHFTGHINGQQAGAVSDGTSPAVVLALAVS